ncbi:lipopolysaccharide biosynthesis protein [Paraglaciecola arctica]|uniref:Polysaccharide transporter, PST family n=1 Tax=Paraglaciecola arctica BSs20135 TaxID=493475 RepID=K6XD34_9ALTE|nr:lipopolysaccharide biosynthesis protein [Paraglaciecola arctica]GAC18544.1 polysaccharide transporter, PST family [Paraglaciecola arctica BSs20135]
MPDKSIAKQIATGTIWSVLMRMTIRMLGIISVLILARILVPADYGIVAKAILLSGFLELVTQFGFNAALIQNQNATKDDYDTVWTLSIIRATALSIVMLISAPWLADYFNEVAIVPLIYAYSISTFIQGFTNVGVIDFQRDMNFNFDFKFNVFQKISSFSVTIAVALTWQSYWAFPLGVLAGSVAALFASFLMSAYRPRFCLTTWRSILNFSKWMFLYETMGAISLKLDTFLLSKFASAEELGVYTISYEVSGMPSTEIAMPVARSALPGLSKLNHNLSKMKETYIDILATTLMVAIPAAVGLSVLAEDIVKVVLGNNWISAIAIIEVLALFGVTRVISACSVSALIAAGKVNILGRFSFFMMLMRLAILPVSVIYYGIMGLTYSVLITGLIGMILMLWTQQFIGLLSIKALLLQIWRIIIAASVMHISLNFLVPLIHSFEWPLLIVLLLEVVIGVLVFSIVSIVLYNLSNSKVGPEQRVLNIIYSKISRKSL